MKRVLFTIATVIVLAFFVGCKSQSSTANNTTVAQTAATETTPTPTEQVQTVDQSLDFQPQVDASTIHSWSDYDKAKNEAWKRYDQRKSNAWKEYETVKGTGWTEYSDFDKAELMKVRTSNRQAYLDYLDAEKLGDYSRKTKLEESVPELAKYKRVTGEKYKVFKKIDEDGYARYKTIDQNAYKVYKVEDDTAYKAYKAIKQ